MSRKGLLSSVSGLFFFFFGKNSPILQKQGLLHHRTTRGQTYFDPNLDDLFFARSSCVYLLGLYCLSLENVKRAKG